MSGPKKGTRPLAQTLRTVLEELEHLASEAYPENQPMAAPEVTVSMPAQNVAPYIETAIWSALSQRGTAPVVVVVDDGSTDGTAEVAESISHPRLSVIRNERARGIGYCHNRVLEHCSTPFIAHVDADDFVLPGALGTMVGALRGSPEAGQAYCNHLLVDANGSLSQKEVDDQAEFLESQRRSHPDYRRGLLVHGMVTNTLRTYPRWVFDQVGMFNEDLRYAVDYEMAVRIADAFDMVYVPDFLYCQRVHAGNTQQRMYLRNLRSWLTRARICFRLMADRKALLLNRRPREVLSLTTLGLLHATRITGFLKALHRVSAAAWRPRRHP